MLCTFDCMQVGSCETSPNQMLLAWTEDTVGGEKYTLHVKVGNRVAAAQRELQPWCSLLQPAFIWHLALSLKVVTAQCASALSWLANAVLIGQWFLILLLFCQCRT